MEKKSEFKTSHALGMLSVLEEMRQSGLICDFTLKIGDAQYRVHRAVIASTSKYFKDMLTSNMKVVQEGYVSLVDVKEKAVQICIDFMYNGETAIAHEDLESTLAAAMLMQLNRLMEICFKCLRDRISSENCIFTIRMAQLYGNGSLIDFAESYLVGKFEEVIATSDFSTVSRESLLRYINDSKIEFELSWKAVVTWFANESSKIEQNFRELIKKIKVPTFSFEFLITIVLKENLSVTSNENRTYVIREWFSDINYVKQHTSENNFFEVKRLFELSGIKNNEEIEQFLLEYLENNYEKLSQKDDFLELEAKDICAVFDFYKAQYFSEQVKWETVVKWCGYRECRKSIFPNCLRESL